MDIKTIWGFRGDADKLNADSSAVKAGSTFTDVDEKYARVLIGKGLAVEIGGTNTEQDRAARPARQPKAASKTSKPAAPAESK